MVVIVIYYKPLGVVPQIEPGFNCTNHSIKVS